MLNEDAPAMVYARFVHWLQEGIRLGVRAELARRPIEPVRVTAPIYPHGAPPIYHLSDDDCAWLMDQPLATGSTTK
jgi:hypothetical protein